MRDDEVTRGKQQALVEEGTGDTTQDVITLQQDRRSEEKDAAALSEGVADHSVDDKRISSEVTNPPILSPQSVTSQDVTFEERAL